MKRISITIDEQALKRLDRWVNEFDLENRGNRSGYLVNLITKNTPSLE